MEEKQEDIINKGKRLSELYKRGVIKDRISEQAESMANKGLEYGVEVYLRASDKVLEVKEDTNTKITGFRENTA